METNAELMFRADIKAGTQQAAQQGDVTERQLFDLMATALEGGILDWGALDRRGKQWQRKPKGISLAAWAAHLLIQGETILLHDREDETEKWTLSVSNIHKGVRINQRERPHDADLDEGDAQTADAIVQYALFEDIVYG